MVEIDWCSIVNIENLESFLTQRLKMNVLDIEKRVNSVYGTYFSVRTDDVVDGILYFGKYGKLSIKRNGNTIEITDDLEFLKNNLLFMQEYLAFINGENKIDGKPRRVLGKTYLDCFKNVFNAENNKTECEEVRVCF